MARSEVALPRPATQCALGLGSWDTHTHPSCGTECVQPRHQRKGDLCCHLAGRPWGGTGKSGRRTPMPTAPGLDCGLLEFGGGRPGGAGLKEAGSRHGGPLSSRARSETGHVSAAASRHRENGSLCKPAVCAQPRGVLAKGLLLNGHRPCPPRTWFLELSHRRVVWI